LTIGPLIPILERPFNTHSPTDGAKSKVSVRLSSAIPVSYLRERFAHDRETGALIWRERPLSHFRNQRLWKAWNARFAGKFAECTNASGYVRIGLTYDGIHYRLRGHRIIWALEHGEWPTHEIDHKNRKRTENRLSNLRAATTAEQSQNRSMYKNNSSGVTGVSIHKPTGRWRAYIAAARRQYHLGLFDTKEEALDARLKAKAALHPFHPSD
jgi:hypothetical protein